MKLGVAKWRAQTKKTISKCVQETSRGGQGDREQEEGEKKQTIMKRGGRGRVGQ